MTSRRYSRPPCGSGQLAPQGSTQIHLVLTSANGTVAAVHRDLAHRPVHQVRPGDLFLIGAAIGVLVLTSVYRGVRRWLHDDAHPPTKRLTHRVAS